MISLLFFAALCTALIPLVAASSAQQLFNWTTCADSTCSTHCTTRTLSQTDCINGNKYKCGEAQNNDCATLESFNDSTCSDGAALGTASAVCGVCQQDERHDRYWRVDCLASSFLAILSYNCDAGCRRCASTASLREGTCAALSQDAVSGVRLASRSFSCNAMTVLRYSDSQCTAFKSSNLVPLQKCFNGQMLACPPPKGRAVTIVRYRNGNCTDPERVYGVSEDACYESGLQFQCPSPGEFRMCIDFQMYRSERCPSRDFAHLDSAVCGDCFESSVSHQHVQIDCTATNMSIKLKCQEGCKVCEEVKPLKIGACTPIHYTEEAVATLPISMPYKCSAIKLNMHADNTCSVKRFTESLAEWKCNVGQTFQCV